MQSRVSSAPASAANSIAHPATTPGLALGAWYTRGLAITRAESHPAAAPTIAKGGARWGNRAASAIDAPPWRGVEGGSSAPGRGDAARRLVVPVRGYDAALRNAFASAPRLATA